MRAGLLPIVLAAVTASAGPQQEPAQLFPSRVELVAVELIVVDGSGRPVRDLAPADFRVEVAGQPRQVLSAEFVPVGLEPDEPLPASDQGFTTNEAVRPGRLVLLVVDTSNIAAGAGRDEIAAAARMLDRLGASDRVGLLTIPSSGPHEELSVDRERIRTALAKVVGQGRMSSKGLSLAEALSCSENDGVMDKERCAQAIRRVCGELSRIDDIEACVDQLRAEAGQLASEYRNASSASRAMLQSTFEALRQVEGQKVVVLVSQGLGFSDVGAQPGGGGLELRQLGAAAEAARVAFYVVPVAPRSPLPAIDVDLTVEAVQQDRALLAWGLESLAAEARGAVLRGEPGRAFERVLRETSGYYRLGFEPQGDDRDGKARKLRVTVARPGLVVRSRPSVTYQPGSSERETTGDLVAALRSPTLATDLPVRVATWSLPGDGPGLVRLLIGAEIGGQAQAQGLAVGYVLLDAGGRVAASASQALLDEPVSSPIPYSTAATVAPGPYTLRVAVRDGRGRLGSVDHHVEAGLVRVGPLAMSDLLLGRAPERGKAFRPAVVPEATGKTLLVQGEISGEKDVLDSASALLEVVSVDSGASLLTTSARLVRADGPGRRVVQGSIDLEGLAPGPYLARVVVASGGIPRGAIVRPFRVRAR